MAVFILGFLVFSVGYQALNISNQAEEELNNKSLVCLKEMQENSCNPFAPANEKCKELLGCVKAADEPALSEVGRLVFVAYEQLQKSSVVPFVVVGLILAYQALKKI